MLVRDVRINELEEENEELRKANDEFLPDNEDPMEGLDIERESDQEDDDLCDDTVEESEPVVLEEDPDEPPYYDDVPTSPDTTVADE